MRFMSMNTGKTPVSELLGISMEKVKEMADVNAIIGEPIKLDDGTTIIPISKVSYGFASGGSDLPSKYDKNLFGGGAGGLAPGLQAAEHRLVLFGAVWHPMPPLI